MEITTTIDGTSIANYGLIVTDGALKDMFHLPRLKAMETNAWQEFDGVEVELGNPVIDEQELNLHLASTSFATSQQYLISIAKNASQHIISFPQLSRTFTARIVGCSNLDRLLNFGTVTLRLAIDNPITYYNSTYPASTLMARVTDTITIDGDALSDYGAMEIEDSITDWMAVPDVMQKLKRSQKANAGVQYDTSATTTFGQMKASFTFLMRETSYSRLWQNYYSLFNAMIQPDARVITAGMNGSKDFEAYYEKCDCIEFVAGSNSWLKAKMTMKIISYL